jgi:hypothetical protein
MFRPCWVIFREKPSVVVTLGFTIQLSENVLLTVHSQQHPSVTTTEGFSLKMTQQCRSMLECVIIDEKKLFVHSLVFKVFCGINMFENIY